MVRWHVLGHRGVPAALIDARMAGHALALVEGIPPSWPLAAHRACGRPACRARSSNGLRPRRGSRCGPGPVSTGRTRKASAGRGCRAGRSCASKAERREPGSFLKGRRLRSSISSAMAWLSSVSEKNMPVAQPGQNPALHDQHAGFHLGLVLRLAHPRRHHRHAVVAGQLGIGRIEVGLVAAEPW